MLTFLATAAAVGYAAKKKYHKKLGKGLGAAGLLFFASGLGVSGFNAFKNVDSIGDFLGAVGQTTMAGAQGLMGAIGLGNQNASSMELGFMGSNIGNLVAGNAGVSASSTAAGSSNVLNKIFGGISSSNDIQSAKNRQLLMSAIRGGAEYYLMHRQYKREEERRARLNFFGDRARGGSSELSFDLPSAMQRKTVKAPEDTVGSPTMPSPFDEDRDETNENNITPTFMRGMA